MRSSFSTKAARRGRYKEMVAFDIETLSKEPYENAVTAAAVYDSSGTGKYFVFKTSVGDDPEADAESDAKAREEFLSILDKAPSLCSFNGIKFDITFMRIAWNLPDDQIRGWVLKTFDVFEASRLALGRYFSLSQVLDKNSLESKSGSGADAIKLAQKHNWEELGSYCLQDTKVTYILSTQSTIVLPVHTTKQQMIVIDRNSKSLFELY